jgi:hypothetical protein
MVPRSNQQKENRTKILTPHSSKTDQQRGGEQFSDPLPLLARTRSDPGDLAIWLPVLARVLGVGDLLLGLHILGQSKAHEEAGG